VTKGCKGFNIMPPKLKSNQFIEATQIDNSL